MTTASKKSCVKERRITLTDLYVWFRRRFTRGNVRKSHERVFAGFFQARVASATRSRTEVYAMRGRRQPNEACVMENFPASSWDSEPYLFTLTVNSLYMVFIYLLTSFGFDTRWQQYTTHLHTHSTHLHTDSTQYSSTVHIYTQTVHSTAVQYTFTHRQYTVQQYSTHLHTDSTQNNTIIHKTTQ